LRIFVCADFSPASDAALRWVNWAQQVGAYQVVVACLEPSPAMLTAMDHPPSALMDDFTLKIGCMQERYFRQRVRKLIPGKRIRVRFEPNWGHSDSHLIQMAAEEHADLIVIGTHVHRGWHLSGRDSVSRGVLHYAPLNVLCVPGQSEATDGTAFSNPELVKKPTKP
jgi:nucleotide-binding universal stress UspA family protein